MSRQGGKNDQSEPSTSSGIYRQSSSRPHSERTPYLRPSGSHRGHSSARSVVKNVSHSTEHASDAHTSSTRPLQYDTIKMEIESTSSGDKQESRDKRAVRETVYVTRPSTLVSKQGKSGARITLQTNYFKLLTTPNWCLYKYRVDFEPEESRTVIRKGMLKLHKEKIGPYIFDGTVLYSSMRLSENIELISVRKSDSVNIKIKIYLVGSMMREEPHYIQFFNIMMRKCLEHLHLQMVGRDYYDARNKIMVRECKLELWPGYLTSIRQHEHDILMCSEISHKIMRQETLLDILSDCYRSNNQNFKKEFYDNVVGLMVLTDYNNNTYRIMDVDYEANPSSTFTMKSGETVSYQEYYKNRYNIIIRNDTQPMLVTQTKPKDRRAGQPEHVYLVPELCRATGLTSKMKENYHIMKTLATHTRMSPESRIEKLRSFNNRLRSEPKVVQEFNDWNMKLDRNLLEVPGRILPSEKLIFNSNIAINSARGEWGREMQKARLLHVKEFKNWAIIGLERDRYTVQDFLNTLQRVSYAIAIRVEQPRAYWLHDDKSSTYAETLEHILSKSTPDLVFCVVTNNRSDRYTAIKKKCCIDRPVASQVFLQKNLKGRNTMSIATKVAIQMNCKLGGAPWCIDFPMKGIMAIGFDICHDSNTKGKDFLAMVATIDTKLIRYCSCITPYHSKEELAEQQCASISKAIYTYRMYNKTLPMYIIIYRDGVSEGAISEVYDNEVTSLKKKLEELYYGPNFKLIYIIVSKRINTRFFYNRNNPPAGTIVDDIVTSSFKYDFFIVSQQVRQGSITPTSYNIISDNSGIEPDIIQQITYKLTHLYYNCSSTVRVPAPCHYAHKLSFLVGQILHRTPSTQLENRLYYL